MSAKKSAEVIIDGKVYTLSGYEEEEYLQKIALYINGKINELREMDQFKLLSRDMQCTLLELNIADDFYKAKDQIEKLEAEVELKDKELYDLKHDLISDQVKFEDMQKAIDNLEDEKKELAAIKTKLEASLEDALLGSISGS
ncbi:MAG: cell division protein ZapA [Lachnospiraceae bacterium]|nr:cell division protein ZapA [Lachnospiraceae bacterium]